MDMNPTREIVIGVVVLVLVGLGVLWYMARNPLAPTIPTETASTTSPTSTGPSHITESGTYYDIDMQYPSSTALANLSVNADVNAVALMKQWEIDAATSFKNDSGLNNLTAEDIQIQQLGADRKYSLAIAYKEYSSAHTVSYVYQIFQDTLGAHPNTTYKTFVFDTETGQNLSLAMLFTPGTDYLGTLSAIAKAELPEIIAARENVSVSEVDMEMLNAGITPTIANYQNFYLDGNDLVILFSPYQIGPYVLGSTEFHIPSSKLTGFKY